MIPQSLETNLEKPETEIPSNFGASPPILSYHGQLSELNSSLMYLAKEFQRHAILSGALTRAIENGFRLRIDWSRWSWWEMMEVGDIWWDRHTNIWKKEPKQSL